MTDYFVRTVAQGVAQSVAAYTTLLSMIVLVVQAYFFVDNVSSLHLWFVIGGGFLIGGVSSWVAFLSAKELIQSTKQ